MNLALVVDDKKDKRRAYHRAWKEKNKERYKAKMKAWNEKNHDKLLEKQRKLRKLPHIAKQRADYQKKYQAEMPLIVRMRHILGKAKQGALKKNREFSITIDDLVWNDFCPVLGIKLNYGKPSNGKKSYDSPSIDRTDSSKGYIPGNVVIMSWRANMLKADAIREEAVKLANYFNTLRS